MIILDRIQIQEQTTANLMSAGILSRDEAETYNELLSVMSWEDMITALIESQQLRENRTNPIDYYLIGEISKN